jgi:4-amino-4-deoxy-L-arabinose transferase-like glycosyltransferase
MKPPGPRAYFFSIFAIAALVLLAPIRAGDLPGYDDALYSFMAKDMLQGAHWMRFWAETHPPLFSLIQAGLFSVFGFSDALAKLPSALAGLCAVLLVYWLARRLYGEWHGVFAMLALAGSAYFVKYAAHAMTDVPFTLFFLCAICAWTRAERDPRWYLAAGIFTGLAQTTRGMMGLGLLAIFAAHAIVARRGVMDRVVSPAALAPSGESARPARLYLISGFVLAFLPLASWYAYLLATQPTFSLASHAAFLDRAIFSAPPDQPWRRYTGAFEYAWMLAKSYWPWLPFLIVGLAAAVRKRDGRAWLLLLWAAVVFGLCAAARSRVLRYMLPAYPAFAILSAGGILRLFGEKRAERGLRILVPVLAAGAIAVAIFPPVNLHARDIRPIAAAETAVTSPEEQIGLYDSGQPRFDEASQLQWYGDRHAQIILTPDELEQWIRSRKARVFVIDRNTYDTRFAGRVEHDMIAQSGRLVCVRLK